MDLISREAVKEQAKASYHVAESMEQLGNLYEDCINVLPSAFEGRTNGEVMKAVFPNMTITHKSSNGVLIVVENLDSPYPHEFYTKWWNSPYQKGGEA